MTKLTLNINTVCMIKDFSKRKDFLSSAEKSNRHPMCGLRLDVNLCIDVEQLKSPSSKHYIERLNILRVFSLYNLICICVFLADGNYALTCGSDKSLKLWSVSRGTLLKTYTGHGYEVLEADS